MRIKDQRIIYKETLRNELCIEEGKQAAELCAFNILCQIVELEKFTSFLLKQAGHTRRVIGCSSLPLNAAVEIIATVEVS